MNKHKLRMGNKQPRDWEYLKTQGRVEEYIDEQDGFITITRTFVSHDGKIKFVEVSSGPTINHSAERIIEIDNQIKQLIEKEEYEKCQKLLNEKNEILKKQR